MSLINELKKLGYRVRERKTAAKTVLQCAIPNGEAELSLIGFGVEIFSETFDVWDSRDQIPKRTQFDNEADLIAYIKTVFPIEKR